MITTIIKRDGSKEAFDANKLNKWVIWSAELNHLAEHIDWSSVVLSAVKKAGSETISSTDLQKLLINELNYKSTWNYSVMAGRLQTALNRKEMFGTTKSSELPTVKQLHDKLIALGLMVNLGFTDYEYELINNLINHDKDFDYAHFQISYAIGKYSLQDRVKLVQYETPQYIAMRMACALTSYYVKLFNLDTSAKISYVKEFYQMFSNNIINAPTPNNINLGTKLNGFASCCLYSVDDNAKSLSIGDYIAYVMTYMSAGIGSNLMTRSKNDPVRSGSISHMGKLPYYKSLAGAVKANLQSGRGGACTTFFSCFDPEVIKIIHLMSPKSPTEVRNRDLDFAILTNKFFAKQVIADKDIFLFNSFTAPDLHELFYSDKIEEFEALYNKYLNDNTFNKTFISAKEVLIAAATQSLEVATMYYGVIDEINRHTPHLDPIYSSNLCVAPETKILTKEYGNVEISSLKDKEVTVWNTEEWSKTTVRQTGVAARLFKVRVDNGSELYTTPYHRWVIQSEYNKQTFRIMTTAELKPGDLIIKHDFSVCDHGEQILDRAYENGLFTADGTALEHNRSRIHLYKEKKELLTQFEDLSSVATVRNIESEKRIEIEYNSNTLKEKFFIPDVSYTLMSRVNWLSGLFDGEGSITDDFSSKSLQFASDNLSFLKELLLLLQELGINSVIKKGQDGGKDRILISNEEIIKLIELGFKTFRVNLSDVRFEQSEVKNYSRILEVIDDGRIDDTYCFTEPKKNMGIFNGIATMNCMEIVQPTKPYQSMKDLYSTTNERVGEISLCSLAAINVSDELTDLEYEKAAYNALLMIDAAIMLNKYEFEHLEVTAKSRMNAGVGLIGVATHMARKHLTYDTVEGRNELHFLAERHSYFVIKASLRLGKELGNAPWIDRTKWPKGWLPIDTYNKRVDELVSCSLVYDWESLRKEIIANGGIRNSSLVAHMPTESSSKASGVPNSIYPVRELSIKKADATNIVEWVAKYSDQIGYAYQSAYALSTVDQIKFYAVFQKFADQAISADLFRDRSEVSKVNASELINEYLTIVKYGLKTKYYTNSKINNTDSVFNNTRGCGSGGCSV